MASSSAFDEEMRKVEAEYEEARRSVIKSQKELDSTVGAAKSKSRVVSAKVDARGELTELKLHTQAWRSMAPVELCKVILTTINEAHAAAQQQLWKSMGD